MEDGIVRRRGWLTREEFLDFLAASNLIPGPNSTEMALHIGYRRAGFPGLLVAGASFIMPAALIVLALAWGYVRYRSIPEIGWILFGIKPVVVAVVLQALVGLARTGIPSKRLWVLAALAVVANGFGLSEILTLLGAGLVFAATSTPIRDRTLSLPLFVVPSAMVAVSTGAIFAFFLKVGSVLYGSGYVLLAFLQSDLVARYRWLTEAELLDAIAVAQMTPGPVFTVATFIGYLLEGLPGAFAATTGIFLPAFFFVAVSGPLVARVRRSKTLSAFLEGVVAASLGIMAVVTFELAKGRTRERRELGHLSRKRPRLAISSELFVVLPRRGRRFPSSLEVWADILLVDGPDRPYLRRRRPRQERTREANALRSGGARSRRESPRHRRSHLSRRRRPGSLFPARMDSWHSGDRALAVSPRGWSDAPRPRSGPVRSAFLAQSSRRRDSSRARLAQHLWNEMAHAPRRNLVLRGCGLHRRPVDMARARRRALPRDVARTPSAFRVDARSDASPAIWCWSVCQVFFRRRRSSSWDSSVSPSLEP